MYCWSCNYPLAGLPSNRCPECGRVFDPHNPATMNLGQPMGRLARLILAPVSLATIALAIVGCILVLVVTRLPLAPLNTWFLDFRYYLRKPDLTRLTWRDTAYLLGLLFSALALAAWLFGTIARQLAQLKYRPPKSQRKRTPVRHVLLFLLIALTTIATGGSWPYRLGQVWVAEQLRMPINTDGSMAVAKMVWLGVWVNIDSQGLVIFRSAIRQSSTPRQRIAATKLLIEFWPANAFIVLRDAAQEEKDPLVLAVQLHALALCPDPAIDQLLFSKLEDKSEVVRAAAADSLGVQSLPFDDRGLYLLQSDPPIALTRNSNGTLHTMGPSHRMPPATQSRLRNLMLTDPAPLVRQAAARALVPYPPQDYKLRVAEWGVWSAEGANLKPVAPVDADLPPFVHPTGDPISSMDPRINRFYAIRKPVLHITASAPMSLDIQVLINQGRTWFAYPMPDDYAVQAQIDRFQKFTGARPAGYLYPLKPLDFPNTLPARAAALKNQPTTLPSPHTGYPWLLPAHPQSTGDAIMQMGLRWQSVIVSPEKLPWMNEPAVPANEKYNWWKRLRNTNCSWLSSRDEAERFLYYDGPTTLKFAVEASAENGLLFLYGKPIADPANRDVWEPREHTALLIQKHSPTDPPTLDLFEFNLVASGPDWRGIPKRNARRVEGDPADSFTQLLKDRGLTSEEATAMNDCWKKEFFSTTGDRLLIFLNRGDYDRFCPIQIRPKPTTLTRVGIIWIEL